MRNLLRGLPMPDRVNTVGFDLRSIDGTRYQVKGRDPTTPNVGFNNFDFDYVVLVNLDEDYRPNGMWKLNADKLRSLCAHRREFRKFQLAQKVFKQAADPIDVNSLRAVVRST